MARSRNLFRPGKPFKISRSGLELFAECPRCFYFDKRLGLSRPSGFPFNLNSAVDRLLKREFDDYRERRLPHPLMTQAGIDAIPFAHPDLEKWRTNFTGVHCEHTPSGFHVYGAVDDLWVNSQGQLIVVDYKATSKAAEITELNEGWHQGYKRQIEIYQWLLRQNGFHVSPTAYWVYANGDSTAERFDQTLRFRMSVIPYTGSDDWVEAHIMAARKCLMKAAPPEPADDCKYCAFASDRATHRK
jgi:hypothetical protein